MIFTRCYYKISVNVESKYKHFQFQFQFMSKILFFLKIELKSKKILGRDSLSSTITVLSTSIVFLWKRPVKD